MGRDHPSVMLDKPLGTPKGQVNWLYEPQSEAVCRRSCALLAVLRYHLKGNQTSVGSGEMSPGERLEQDGLAMQT